MCEGARYALSFRASILPLEDALDKSVTSLTEVGLLAVLKSSKAQGLLS